ncbi:MAG: DinB family protein [Chitinophagaceae bacterium]
MEIKTVSNRMYAFIVLFDLQTTYFSSVLDGISDQDSHNRLNTKANHIAWLTGSLVQQRFEIAGALGEERHQGAYEFFKDNKGIQDDATYPSLTAFKKDWQIISPILRELLVNVPDEKLDAAYKMPGVSMTYFDMVSFIIYREANCIGQVALWRRLLGYEAMKYM